MINILIEILQTPYLWQSLGLITAISLFISPVLYNGDYRTASKSVVIIGGYSVFSAMLMIFHINNSIGCGKYCWLRPVICLLLVAISYIIGLFLGVYIHNQSKKRLIKK